ncbi:hypothetical protein GN958_ATG18514 [Phytophthora infestans]|uniref:Uncharacterized protein n=1 Tax=Phytophthora infestans TaxID=4787 RepID=A0A8S9TU86_PHYIN|nr:hypothetical protein GN958_ATG18514 [Phytophthora infestans]
MDSFIKISTWLLVVAVSVVSAKMHIWVYGGAYYGADRWSMKFSTTQKCYTFGSCLDDKGVGADWEGIDASAVAFMVWADGIYATKGIEFECLERSALNATNASDYSAVIDDVPLPSNGSSLDKA